MLSPEDERDLEAYLLALALKAMPVMAHNAAGVANANMVTDTLISISRSANRALSMFVRRCNAQTCIYRLPDEILLRIMSLLPYYARLGALAVCWQWYRVIQPRRELWEDPVISLEMEQGRWVSEVQKSLALSQGRFRSLCLRLSGCSHCVPLTAVLTPTMAHLRDLDLFLRGPALCPAWVEFFACPAPTLVNLTVRLDTDQGVRLPDNLFGGVAPNLRIVILAALSLPAHPGDAFKSVRAVMLAFLAIADSDELARISRSCPQLVALAIGAETFVTGSEGDDFNIPSLRGIAFNGVIPPNGPWRRLMDSNTSRSELRINRPSLHQMSIRQ
ncbi:hypothetical protein EXIGLDRAFT_766168 [Exidia glandulosa HHB12029]|uniref:F-box domain-containing protein n=1 Tax=Exidia glandulosa HHB12029 TaxID=1314781 RepID=A0A165JXG7_EXIGL|nr:hypothetical protein EXIGLDRAFT_766168 [Exidia glandulosa HHB12029]